MLLFIPAALLLAGCSSDDGGSGDTSKILLRTGVTEVTEGTRASTYDVVADLEAEGSFTCAAYEAGTTTPFISPTRVDWTGSGNVWEFSDGEHRWPRKGSLDFFAYFPATLPDYASVSYSPSASTLTCTNLPVALTPEDGTKEFVYAIAKGQSQNDHIESGVSLYFKHVFARLKFDLSAANGTNVTVNSITIPGVYRNGTCILGDSPSWSGLDNTGDLVITGTSATATYLVIPNNYVTKTITVNATWNGWTENITKDVTASVDIDWMLGYSYTYELTLDNYVLQVNAEKYTEQW